MVTRILSKALPFVLAAVSASLAQCVNHRDPNGNICTVVQTSGGHYDPYTSWSFPEVSEDGVAFPADYNAAVSAPSNYYFNIGLAYDPLKEPGGPLANPYGYVTTDLTGNVNSSTTNNVIPAPTTVGSVMERQSWTFTVHDAASENYPYVWKGTYKLTWVCTKVTIKFGRKYCNSVPHNGTATLSATYTP